MATLEDKYSKEIMKVRNKINTDIDDHIRAYHRILDEFERRDLVEYINRKQLEMIEKVLNLVNEYAEEKVTSQNPSVTP